MNIEHMQPLIHGHQLRGQSGQQLFLVTCLRGPLSITLLDNAQ